MRAIHQITMAVGIAAVAVINNAATPDAFAQAAGPDPAVARDLAIPEPPVPIPSDAAPTESAATAGLLPTTPADGCELHLWPAERMHSQTTGWLSGLGAIGSLVDQSAHAKRDSSNQSLLATALDSPSQLDALQSLDLRALLSLPSGTTIVRHDTPLERKTMNSVKTRRSDSAAKCYSELIVADVFYQKAAIYGRSLRTLFMYRNFGDDQKIDKQYKAWGGNGLKLFPPEEGADALAALDELVGVYKLNFDEYARNARASLGQKAR